MVTSIPSKPKTKPKAKPKVSHRSSSPPISSASASSMHRRLSRQLRHRHPLLFGTAAFSLLVTALPSSALGGNLIHLAFASSSSSSSSASRLQKHLQRGNNHQKSLFFGIPSNNNSRSSSFGTKTFSSSSFTMIRGGASEDDDKTLNNNNKQPQQQNTTSSNKNNNNKMHHHQYPHAPLAAESPFQRPVKKVVIVGGTHGNEYTGVWCIKSIEKQRELLKINNDADNVAGSNDSSQTNNASKPFNVFQAFPSLEMDTLLANPVAFMQNKRFVDMDLNREFSIDKLKRTTSTTSPSTSASASETCDIKTEFCSTTAPKDNIDASSLPHEALRAREIEAMLGPKILTPSSSSSSTSTTVINGNSNSNTPPPSLQSDEETNPDPHTDLIIDLHTTTCNMGISLIIPEGDALMSAAAAYVMHKCQTTYGYSDNVQILMHALPKRKDRMNLSSCGRHGFTVEVGPVPQGVLRHDVVEKTEAALHSLLEFLHLRNLELEEEEKQKQKKKKGGEEVVADEEGGKGERGGSNNNNNNNNNNNKVLDQLRQIYPDGNVPCYRSAPAVRPGELSGKISWPTDPTNPNFPALMVHKSVQDRDFQPLRIGDPLFIALDGTVVPYDGSHGEEVHLIFVNEGGYYYESSGTGIGVAVKSQFDWETGWFVVMEEEGGMSEEVMVEEKDSYE